MPTLLRIDSSPMETGTSLSRQLTEEFCQRWKESQPRGTVITRDLPGTPVLALNAEWITAAYTAESDLTSRQWEILALSDELIAELQLADEYVLGVPLHNFSVSGVLKLWIDQVLRAGKTFSYAATGPIGLLSGKRATFILTSGGVYEPGTPKAMTDFVEPYLRYVFGFMGITDTRFIRAGGTSKARGEAGREALLQAARALIRGELQAV